jgi:hypothetical protein
MELPEQLFAVTLDANGDISIPLDIYSPADTVYQEVRTQDDGERIRARVLFTERLESVSDGPIRVYGATAIETSRFYMTALLPGSSRYGIKVIPQGDEAEAYPPRYYDDVEVTRSGGLWDSEGTKLDYLEVDPAYVYVTGVVRRGSQPIANLVVEARDPDSGRVLSTPSITGCGGGLICGQFTTGLAPEVTSFSLEIYRQNEPWYPAVTVPDISIETILEEQGTTEAIDLGIIDLEAPLGEVEKYRGRVEAPVMLDDGSSVIDGVPDCRVVFESDDIAGGRVVRHAKTDQTGEIVDVTGNASVDLFPGLYEVTIIPPVPFNDSVDDYAVLGLADPLDITGTMNMEEQVFTLERRPTITGRVIGDEAQLLHGTVRAEPTEEAFLYSRSNTASIGPEGTFSIWLDEDNYWLIAEAPVESGYAFGIVDVDAADYCEATLDNDCELDIGLSIPFVSRATLILRESAGVAGVGLAGATVEWYEVEETNERKFHIVGRSISDDEGRVTALLPPTIQYLERRP